MQTSRTDSGFTLIEMMIVVAIIGIMATMAIATVNINAPRRHLHAGTSEVRGMLIDAHTTAINTRRVTKVCMFKDNDPFDAVPGGRVISFECRSEGTSACPPALLCNDVTAASPTPYNAAQVDGPRCDDPVGNLNLWCIREELDFAGPVKSLEGISINGFADFDIATPDVLNALEVSFASTGFVELARTSPGNSSAHIAFSTFNLCDAAPPSCTGFTYMTRFNYVAGGITNME